MPRSRFQERVAFSEDELLHVFWGEIVPHVLNLFGSGDRDAPAQVAALTDRALPEGSLSEEDKRLLWDPPLSEMG